MSQDDITIEYLLDLDGNTFVVDDELGLWVKFFAKKVVPTKERPHGIRYSLTLHDRNKNRIMGFDNAHIIEFGGKRNVAPTKAYDHWHRDGDDAGRPYEYVNAAKLMEDFWNEVEKKVQKLKEGIK